MTLPTESRPPAGHDADGVRPARQFYDKDHQPALGHEYQFDLDLDLADARAASDRLIGFFRRYTGGAREVRSARNAFASGAFIG